MIHSSILLKKPHLHDVEYQRITNWNFPSVERKALQGAPSLPLPSTYFYRYFKIAPNNKLNTISLTCSNQQIL